MPLFRKAVRDLRWHIVGYGAGLGLLGAMYVLLYPAFADTFADFEMPEGFAAFFGDVTDLGNARNFIQIEFFSLWMPLLLAIYAIVAATAQLAGDEQSGTLEMVLAQPVTRRRIFIERFVALALGAVLICGLASVGFLLSAPFVDLRGEIAVWELAVAPFGTVSFALALISLSLLVGTLLPRRGQSTALLTALIVAFYLMDVLPGLVDGLGPLRYGSAFYYSDASRLLLAGVSVWHQAVLLGAVALFALLALAAFDERDIGTGRSPLAAMLRRWALAG